MATEQNSTHWKAFSRLNSDGLPEIVVADDNGCPIAVVGNHAEYAASAALIVKAVNSYAEMKKALEWQPIETAPKDGTIIDLWGEFETGARRASDAFWNVDASEWQLGTFHAGQFVHRPNITHWMPLPAAPVAEG